MNNKIQKSNIMEIIAILSLSLILTSALSVSGTVPDLLNYFSDHPRSSVEFLISIPSISMTIMIALSPFVSKFLSERLTIITGLIIAGFGGVSPFFFTNYISVLLARILFGLGLGLINTRAISIIGERFSEGTRAKLLGFRISAETIGQTLMTLVSGQLLIFGWKTPFLVYSICFVILFIYIIFVPKAEVPIEKNDQNNSIDQIEKKMSQKQLLFVLTNAVFIGLLIATNVSNALRIPSLVLENNIGTAIEANRVLSLSMFAGFLAGLVFGKLLSMIRKSFLPMFLLTGAIGLLLIPLSTNMFLIQVAAFVCGFSITNCVSYVFTNLSEKVPVESLNNANAIVLIGCNLGATIAPMILNLIGLINNDLSTSFYVYSAAYVCIAIVTFISSRVVNPIKKNGNKSIEEI